ncbi:MAG: hypothetical protein SW833_23845 [Cyanobacteriota bacterium]|nr:hypothetical protein [Cyanobacteriota bacterium]
MPIRLSQEQTQILETLVEQGQYSSAEDALNNASRDLSEISDRFLVQSVEAGDRFVEEFNKKCQSRLKWIEWLSRHCEVKCVTIYTHTSRWVTARMKSNSFSYRSYPRLTHPTKI